MSETLSATTYRPSTQTCQCNCPDGDCQHKWDGKKTAWDELGSHCESATCSRCGMTAMAHDIWVMP